MKDAQDAMERVLRGLREVEAPAGLEQRVLRGVEDRVSAGAGRRRWFDGLLGVRVRTGAALGAGALLAGMCLVVVWMEAAGARQVIPSTLSGRAVGEAAVVVAPERSVSTTRQVEGAASLVRRRPVVRVRRVDVEFAPGSEETALREMRAPSMPAPPLPLTREEQLLLRVVKTGAPEEIAMLDAAQRERAEAVGKAEVQRFFEPPETKAEEHE